ncbi:toll/interleukin-1 receptor domain-containing protein [Paenisporosarcina sp. FSL H8-0542]|uniref:toll/interleukin-1 receptor domain-containing protein n=1 Tax=Paenisporosarcina sp. FSL H8-0542 TaxID=2921401 RepID=UPI00315999D1
MLQELVEYKHYKDIKRAELFGEEILATNNKLKQEVEKIIQRLRNEETNQEHTSSFIPSKEYDVFISHASEDKQAFVEPLTKALKSAGIKTWYDADQIGWGESIRQSLDRGLINSRFCIVVLSSDFFRKHWAGTYELNAIFQRVAIEQNSLILPIWHNITLEEISRDNLTLPDIKALNSSIHNLEQIVNEMKIKLSSNA